MLLGYGLFPSGCSSVLIIQEPSPPPPPSPNKFCPIQYPFCPGFQPSRSSQSEGRGYVHRNPYTHTFALLLKGYPRQKGLGVVKEAKHPKTGCLEGEQVNLQTGQTCARTTNNTSAGAEQRHGPSFQAEEWRPSPLRSQVSLKVLSKVQSCPQRCILEPLVNQGAP